MPTDTKATTENLKEAVLSFGKVAYKRATPAQMIGRLKIELFVTPRWRFLKRMQIKRNIEFWEKQEKI